MPTIGNGLGFTIDDEDTTPPSNPQFSLDSAYGSVKPHARPEDFDELARRSKDVKVEEYIDLIASSRPKSSEDGGG